MSGKAPKAVDVGRALSSLARLEPVAHLIGDARGVLEALRDAGGALNRLTGAIGQAKAEADEAVREVSVARDRARQESATVRQRVSEAESKAKAQIEGFQRDVRQAEQDAVAARKRAQALDEQADHEARDRKAVLAKELGEEEKVKRGKIATLTARVSDLERQVADAEAKLAALQQAREKIRREAALVASA